MVAGRRRSLIIGVAVSALAVGAAWWLWPRSGRRPADGSASSRGAGTLVSLARPQDAEPGSIEGTVRVAGTPVAAASVCGRADSRELSSDEVEEPVCTITDMSGRYRLERLVAAGYRVGARMPGLGTGVWRGADGDDEVRVDAGAAVVGIDVDLVPGEATISGTVVDALGGPVAGARVEIGAGYQDRSGWQLVHSDEAGRFAAQATPGLHWIQAAADGYASDHLSVSAPGSIQLELTPESVLAGQVIDAASGQPVAGILVHAATEGFPQRSARTDPGGRFRIGRLPPGRYKAIARAPALYGEAHESRLLGIAETVEDVVVLVRAAVSVSGRVIIDDAAGTRPCPDGAVVLHTRGDDSWEGRHESSLDPDGRVSFTGLLPGSYEVEVHCQDHLAAPPYPPVTVTSAPSDGHEWKVTDGRRLRGRVVDTDGKPIAAAEVMALAIAAATVLAGMATADDRGEFELKGLPAAQLRVTAMKRSRSSGHRDVDLTGGDVAPIELVMPGTGSIEGRVRTASGAPVAGVWVRGSSDMFDWEGSARTAADGRFRMDDVPAGSHQLEAGLDEESFGYRGFAPGPDAVAVTLEAGSVARAELRMPGQDRVIDGIVVDGAGVPLADIYVTATPDGHPWSLHGGWRRRVLTDLAGRFAIGGLGPGKHTLRAFRHGGGEVTRQGVDSGSEVRLVLAETGSIAGSVTTAAGAAPASFEIKLMAETIHVSRTERFNFTGGAFAMRDLPAGSYQVAADGPDGSATAEVTVGAGEHRIGVRLKLEGRVTVVGRLIASGTGKPLADMQVEIVPEGRRFRMYRAGTLDWVSGLDGRFRAQDAPAGPVLIEVGPRRLAGWEGLEGYGRRKLVLQSGGTVDVGDIEVFVARVKPDQKPGRIGISWEWNESKGYPVITAIREGSPAEASGLIVGDLIRSVDGHDVHDAVHVFATLLTVPPGTTLELGLERGATVQVTARAAP